MARGDGKTTRQLQKAIQHARDGTFVMYLTRGPVGYYIGLARQLAPDAIAAESRRQLILPEGNAVEFRESESVRKEHIAGRSGVAIVDHAAFVKSIANNDFHLARWVVDYDVPLKGQQEQD